MAKPKPPVRLDEKIDEQDFLRKADSFLFTSRFIGHQPIELMAPMIAPMIICHAFCTELYLKILCQLERDEPPFFGHDLQVLVSDLSGKSKRRIRRAWTEYNAPSIKSLKNHPGTPEWAKKNETFDEALKVSAKAFIDFRYANKGELIGWQFGGVADELREMILELRPDWRIKTGPRTALDPKPKFAEPENNNAGLPAGWAILNRQPAALGVQIQGRPNPKNRSAG